MTIWTRMVAVCLALGMALTLGVDLVSAAPAKDVATGTNLEGRAGLIYGDTSDVAGVGRMNGGVFLTYQSYGVAGFSGSFFNIPGGIRFGIEKDLELSLGGNAMINSYPDPPGGSDTFFNARAGFKYRIAGKRNAPDFSLGGDVTLPVSPTFGSTVIIGPRGTVSYVLKNGLLLNGDMGIIFATNGGSAYVRLDLGAAYPFSDKVTGIASLGANQAGQGGSVFSAGARFNLTNIDVLAFLGAPLNGGNVVLGGGIGF